MTILNYYFVPVVVFTAILLNRLHPTKGAETAAVPSIVIDDKPVSVDALETVPCGDQDCFVVNADKHLWYAPDFLSEHEIERLQLFCEERFQNSPVRLQQDDDDTTTSQTNIRTSESCPMVPAKRYLDHPQWSNLVPTIDPLVLEEIEMAWNVSQRAAALVGADPRLVEPLQMVRYRHADAYYQVHHDHGSFYGKSSELRPFTILVYLNTVELGGATYFPQLQHLRVYPHAGDAILWSNVDAAVTVDSDMVHAGEPPTQGEKYALNIWIGQSDTLQGGSWGNTQKRRNQDEL